MFKRLIAVFTVIMFLVGCAGTGWNVPAGNQALLGVIEVSGYNLGYYIGHSKTTADDQIANAYKLARMGTLTPQEVASAIAALKLEDPQLAGSLAIALKRMGAIFDPTTGGLVDISGIPVEYWDTAAEGYVLGYEIGLMGKKAPKKVSAVASIKPKVTK